MTQLANVPSKTSLIYDVFGEQDSYSIYIVAKYEAFSDGKISYTLFRHDIDKTGNSRSFVKASLPLGEDICVDEIKVGSKLIVLACLESKQIHLIDREKMNFLDPAIATIALPEGEVFSPVTGIGSVNFKFKSDYFKILDREGHLRILISTYHEATNSFKLHTYELITI